MMSNFEKDVVEGLTAKNKFLRSKYIYDKAGSDLFKLIMELDEYYPTRCELEIIECYKEDILAAIENNTFDIIELGPGDGRKTKILLDYFLTKTKKIKYLPVDIDSESVALLENELKKLFPNLEVKSIANDYLHALFEINRNKQKKVVLFLGTSLGNFTDNELFDFFNALSNNLSAEDFVLIGIDLKKNPDTILTAYNDSNGITKAFNLNLLQRINRDLGGNFNVENFIHCPFYNPMDGKTESTLVSMVEHDVWISKLNLSVHFDQWEAIHTETSKKYNLGEIEDISKKFGFKIVKNFFDRQHFFVNTLWKKI